MKKVSLILILLVSTLAPLVYAQPSTKPDWAVEGTFVQYGWDLWEYCPADEVQEKIDMMKHYADLAYMMELIDANDTVGVFNITVPTQEGSAVWEYNWDQTSWNVTLGLPIYYPESKLQDAPLVELETALGTFNAYMVETEMTYGDTVRNETYWIEQTTKVALLVVSTTGTETVDLIVMPLLGTNIWNPTREYNVVYGENTYNVTLQTNSTIQVFVFSQEYKTVGFTLMGPEETNGFCEVTIPNQLQWGEFTLYKDSEPLTKDVNYTQTENATHTVFNITYTHSIHSFEIVSTETIPEISTTVMITLFTAATIIATVYTRKKHKNKIQ